MYSVWVGEYGAEMELLYSTDTHDPETAIYQATGNLELNKAGSFEFTMPPGHPFYDRLKRMRTYVSVKDDDTEIFYGRVFKMETNFYKERKVYCEGILACFNDTFFYPIDIHTSVRDLLRLVINNHTNNVAYGTYIEVGEITAAKASFTGQFKFSSYRNTWEVIESEILGYYGGYLRVRHTDLNVIYIDYVDIYANHLSTQLLEFAVNMEDFTEKESSEEIWTCIMATGDEDENGNTLLVVSQDDSAVEKYGLIYKLVSFSGIKNITDLQNLADEYVRQNSIEKPHYYEIKAVDLHHLYPNYDKILLGYRVHLYSEPHGLDVYLPCQGYTFDIQEIANNSYSFGMQTASISQRYTDTQNNLVQNYEEQQAQLDETKEELANTQSDLATTNSNLADTNSALGEAQQTIAQHEDNLNRVGDEINDHARKISLIASDEELDQAAEMTVDGKKYTITGYSQLELTRNKAELKTVQNWKSATDTRLYEAGVYSYVTEGGEPVAKLMASREYVDTTQEDFQKQISYAGVETWTDSAGDPHVRIVAYKKNKKPDGTEEKVSIAGISINGGTEKIAVAAKEVSLQNLKATVANFYEVNTTGSTTTSKLHATNGEFVTLDTTYFTTHSIRQTDSEYGNIFEGNITANNNFTANGKAFFKVPTSKTDSSELSVRFSNHKHSLALSADGTLTCGTVYYNTESVKVASRSLVESFYDPSTYKFKGATFGAGVTFEAGTTFNSTAFLNGTTYFKLPTAPNNSTDITTQFKLHRHALTLDSDGTLTSGNAYYSNSTVKVASRALVESFYDPSTSKFKGATFGAAVTFEAGVTCNSTVFLNGTTYVPLRQSANSSATANQSIINHYHTMTADSNGKVTMGTAVGYQTNFNIADTAFYKSHVGIKSHTNTTPSYSNSGQYGTYSMNVTATANDGTTDVLPIVFEPTAAYNAGQSFGEALHETDYNDGYNAGYNKGEEAGTTAGYTVGEKIGYDNGYSAGEAAHANDYADGYVAGLRDSANSSYYDNRTSNNVYRPNAANNDYSFWFYVTATTTGVQVVRTSSNQIQVSWTSNVVYHQNGTSWTPPGGSYSNSQYFYI